MKLTNVDLNLLVALRALLQERNVTRAAQIIGVSQPAMSNALARLRRQFGDDLLVREGRGLTLTPVARELRYAVEPALAMVERALRIQASFDPASTTQTFRIAASDYGMSLLSEPLRAMEQVAPGVVVELIQVDRAFVRDSEAVMRKIDLMVAPRAFLRGYPNVPLSNERWVAVAAADATDTTDALAEDDLRGRSLVGIFHDLGSGAHIERLLTVRGINPAGTVNVEAFSMVPSLVEGTNRIGFLPVSMALRLQPGYAIRLLEIPFQLDPLVECLYWHPSAERDPAHMWLRRMLVTGRSEPVGPGEGDAADA
ncbi:MAG TPA: LysR family transcriptional regulator [Blastococcus sp.]|nr:LysR family transcriptional regulator [Blastococcus sp.]